MKKIIVASIAVILGIATNAQVTSLPSVNLKNLDGKDISSKEISNDGKPVLICFWATWCSPCKKELNTYADYYDEWQKETGVKIYAVSIDDQRTVNSVKPYVNSVSWEYEILSDVNKTFYIFTSNGCEFASSHFFVEWQWRNCVAACGLHTR